MKPELYLIAFFILIFIQNFVIYAFLKGLIEKQLKYHRLTFFALKKQAYGYKTGSIDEAENALSLYAKLTQSADKINQLTTDDYEHTDK